MGLPTPFDKRKGLANGGVILNAGVALTETSQTLVAVALLTLPTITVEFVENSYKGGIVRKPVRFCAASFTNNTINSFAQSSTAHVAGIAALMLQSKGGPKSLTPQQVTQFFEMSAVDMDDPYTNGFDVGFDDATGFGLIDALAALDLVTATKAPTKAPTKKPTKNPTKAPTKFPTKAPIKNQKCGLLRLSIFCPFSDTGCGLFKRIFKIDGC